MSGAEPAASARMPCGKAIRHSPSTSSPNRKFRPLSRSPDGIGRSGIRVSRRCCGWFSPEKIELYNGFGRPGRPGTPPNTGCEPLKGSRASGGARRVRRASCLGGTGRFWQEPQANEVDRKTSVDRQLLSDLAALERDLVSADMSRPDAQGLIGRSIFHTSTSSDRRIVTTRHLAGVYGRDTLAAILRDRRATKRLFDWLREVFNGGHVPVRGRIRTARGSPSSGRGLPRGRGPRHGTNDVLSVPVST